MKRAMGIDPGEKNTGLSLSDLTMKIACPLTVITGPKKKLFQALDELIAKHFVTELVLGNPLNADGTKGPQSLKAEKFAKQLEHRYRLPVFLQDERWTTVRAKEIARECGISEKQNRKRIDKVASSLMLQSYLDNRNKT